MRVRPDTPDGMKPKDLMGIPWRLAFALQDDGGYLRADIIWHKPNAMPESVRDRPTRAHEYSFLFSKNERYKYYREAILEPNGRNCQGNRMNALCNDEACEAIVIPSGSFAAGPSDQVQSPVFDSGEVRRGMIGPHPTSWITVMSRVSIRP